MDPELIDGLREDLDAAGFRTGEVRALLGADADDARRRGVFAPALRALAAREAEPLATLTRLFLLGLSIPEEQVNAALPRCGAEGGRRLGLLSSEPGGGVRAELSLNPVEMIDPGFPEAVEWWIASDLDDQLRRGPARSDHVMGVGGATRSLISQAPPGAVPRSLDLGTGNGIVALHLALRSSVVATDVSMRALDLARLNARLNALHERIEFRHGDLFGAVEGETFDLILSNPPFVVSPRGDDTPRYVYRDGGMVGDALAERVVREGPRHLAEGGTLLCLANWESPWGGDGLDRVADWIERSSAPIAAWVIERDRVSPARYAETWARDGGARPGDAEFEELLRRWLEDFAARRVVGLGLGSIRLRRLGAGSERVIRIEQAEGAFSRDAGARLDRAFGDAISVAGMSDAEVLARRWRSADGVAEYREHRPGQESPRSIALGTESGIARRVGADPLLAAAVGACDGDLTLLQIADALATVLELDAAEVSAALVEGARELVWLGMLAPASADRLAP